MQTLFPPLQPFPNCIRTRLLRLFNSEMFDSRMCLTYIQKNATDPAALSYLCENVLTRYPSQEIEFLLPQLIHLILSSPGRFLPLENFLKSQIQVNHHM